VKDFSIVNRAFEIAPQCSSIAELKRRLIREGHRKVNRELSGWQIRRKLIATIGPERSRDLPPTKGNVALSSAVERTKGF
jgi:hypothetical protein